jgi:hypothetical protein
MNASEAVNHVWYALLTLEDAARTTANRSKTELVTERTADLSSAALRYAAAHLEAQQENNEAARQLRQWAARQLRQWANDVGPK